MNNHLYSFMIFSLHGEFYEALIDEYFDQVIDCWYMQDFAVAYCGGGPI